MIEVNLNNYESYAIDYVEGRLFGKDLSAFESFLIKHPEVRDELDSIKDDPINIDIDVAFDDKAMLKKEALLSQDINEDNYQTYFVAYHEGDLSETTRKKVLAFVNHHPGISSEFEPFAKLRFKPDRSLHFPLKRQIKKATPVLILYRGLRIAASVALLIGLAWYFSQLNITEQQYTERSNPAEINKDIESQDKLNISDKPENEIVLQPNEEVYNSDQEKTPMVANYKENPVEYKSETREAAPQMASTSIKNTTIDQRVNSDLKYKTAIESKEVIVEDGSILKIKLPKLFKRKSDSVNDDGSETLAKAKIKFSKNKKNPNRVNYVDLGPFKVYKKKGVSANASDSVGSGGGM